MCGLPVNLRIVSMHFLFLLMLCSLSCAAIERYFASPASMQPALLILIDGLRPVDMPMPPSVAGMCRNCRRFSSTAATRGMPHAACRVPRAACRVPRASPVPNRHAQTLLPGSSRAFTLTGAARF